MKYCLLSVLLISIVIFHNDSTSAYASDIVDGALTPYTTQHGSGLDHRSIQECHNLEFGSAPHELYPVSNSQAASGTFVKVNRFVKTLPSVLPRTVRGHIVTVYNPLKSLSVLEPDQPGGCSLSIRQTVAETSRKGKCAVAVNAGYFDTKKGSCLGNVISDGQKAHDSKGVQNAHFGLTEDGKIFIGYLSEEQFLNGKLKQLVGGVVWILRNGTGFVNQSKKLECESTEETGTMEHFVSVLSARSAIGHDKDGNIVIVQVDGKSSVDGINLYEMENLLKEFGLVNAINMDGGGSSTLVSNGVTINYPYDECPGKEFSCDRKVSTIVCVHPPYCDPIDCSSHGTCSMGQCVCEENWQPPKCDRLFCGRNNCSQHGICMAEGCMCHPGYFGKDCNQTCESGYYGSMCTKLCKCFNSVGCDAIKGTCLCEKGYTGEKCEKLCPVGFYGMNCESKCHCSSCYCDPVSGDCDIFHNSSLYQAAQCLAQNIVQEQHLVKDNTEERRKWYLTLIVLGAITALCVASFVLFLFCSCSCRCQNEQVLCFRKEKKQYSKYPLQLPSGYLSDSTSESETLPLQKLRKT